MLAHRSLLRLPAALATGLVLLMGANEVLTLGVCVHHGSHEHGEHGTHLHGESSHAGHTDAGHTDAHVPDHDPSHEAEELCRTLCVASAGAGGAPEPEIATVVEPLPTVRATASPGTNPASIRKPTAHPHFLPPSQAPPLPV